MGKCFSKITGRDDDDDDYVGRYYGYDNYNYSISDPDPWATRPYPTRRESIIRGERLTNRLSRNIPTNSSYGTIPYSFSADWEQSVSDSGTESTWSFAPQVGFRPVVRSDIQVENEIRRRPVPTTSSRARAVIIPDAEDDMGIEVGRELRNFVIQQRRRPDLSRLRGPPPPSTASASALAPRNKECLTCLEELPLSSFPKKPITRACEHPAGQICKPCLKRSLQAQLDGLGNQGFTCPLCKKPLSEHDVQTWANPEIVRRHNSLQTRKTLANDPKFIWCSNPKCKGGQIHESGAGSPIMTCMYCHARTCFTHQRPWHEGMTCYEFDHPEVVSAREEREQEEKATIKRKRQEAMEADEAFARELEAAEASNLRHKKNAAAKREIERRAQQQREEQRRKEEQEKWQREARQRERMKRLTEERLGEAEVRGTSKVCPGRGCAYRVYRDGGCRHITCTRCGQEWCWECLQVWERGHLDVCR